MGASPGADSKLCVEGIAGEELGSAPLGRVVVHRRLPNCHNGIDRWQIRRKRNTTVFGQAVRDAILTDYPNPDRVGCPENAMIREVAFREELTKDEVWEHITHCSPCYAEFLKFKEEWRASRRGVESVWIGVPTRSGHPRATADNFQRPLGRFPDASVSIGPDPGRTLCISLISSSSDKTRVLLNCRAVGKS